MRTFIGINLDTSVKESIKAIQSTIKRNADRGRYKYIDNFHITLKFLGEIEQGDVSKVNKVLGQIAAIHEAFSLEINKVGFFKGRGSIHALWLGMVYDNNPLISLYSSIEKGLIDEGFKKDNRPYTPHITIAQDLVLNTDFNVLKDRLDLSIIPPINLKSVLLIKSEEIRGKRIYTPVSTFRLKSF